MSAPASPPIRREWAVIGYVALLCIWMVTPFVANRDVAAQDVVPFIAAADIADQHPDAVYPGAGDGIRPPLRLELEMCPAYEDREECHRDAVPFISPPVALPVASLLSPLEFDRAGLLVRLAGAGALVVGMAVLWKLLADSSPAAPMFLCLTAAALTPLTIRSVYLGQTSPMLFVAAIVPVSWLVGRRAVAYAVPLTIVVVTKLFPIAVLPFLAWYRRWNVVGWTLGFLTVVTAITLATEPASLWGDFVSSSRQLARLSPRSSFNASLEAWLLPFPGFSTGLASAGAWLIRGAVIAGIAWRWRRYALDHRWALLWLALVLCVPQFWSHYLWVVIGAVAVAVAAHHLAGRYLPFIPLLAVATTFLSNEPNRWHVVAILAGAFALTFALAEFESRSHAKGAGPERTGPFSKDFG